MFVEWGSNYWNIWCPYYFSLVLLVTYFKHSIAVIFSVSCTYWFGQHIGLKSHRCVEQLTGIGKKGFHVIFADTFVFIKWSPAKPLTGWFLEHYWVNSFELCMVSQNHTKPLALQLSPKFAIYDNDFSEFTELFIISFYSEITAVLSAMQC